MSTRAFYVNRRGHKFIPIWQPEKQELAFCRQIAIIGTMKQLTSDDERRLEAARAWLYLGNLAEANEELEQIEAVDRSLPEVLTVRLEIYSRMEKWEAALHIVNHLISQKPDRITYWIQKSQILKKLGQIEASLTNLHLALESKVWPVDDLYEFAIEAQKLNFPDAAFECVRAAVGKTGFQQLRNLVLETDLLRPIHTRVSLLS